MGLILFQKILQPTQEQPIYHNSNHPSNSLSSIIDLSQQQNYHNQMQQNQWRLGRKTKVLIKPVLPESPKQIRNIFQHPNLNPEQDQPRSLHHIVGDNTWKKSFYGQILSKKQSQTKQSEQQLPAIGKQQPQYSMNMNKDLAISTQKSNYSRFCLDQYDKESREKRVLQNYQKTQSTWKQSERNILNKIGRGKSLTFQAVAKVYSHPNPDKMQILNDYIPKYWEYSLRDNNKILKKHLRGNPFRQETAQEMMQTMDGLKRLQSSIPQLKKYNDRIVLKGSKLQRQKISNKSINNKESELLKQDYNLKSKWLNEISYTQTISTRFTFE